jgi:hypothetical protein
MPQQFVITACKVIRRPLADCGERLVTSDTMNRRLRLVFSRLCVTLWNQNQNQFYFREDVKKRYDLDSSQCQVKSCFPQIAVKKTSRIRIRFRISFISVWTLKR